jgi:hypothetical protein
VGAGSVLWRRSVKERRLSRPKRADSQFEVGTEFPHIEIPRDAFESAEGKLGELFKLRKENDS